MVDESLWSKISAGILSVTRGILFENHLVRKKSNKPGVKAVQKISSLLFTVDD